MNKRTNLGQATVEYILVFTMLIVVVATMVKTINNALKSGAGTLAYTISQHLTIGVCDKTCFSKDYINY